MRGYILGNGAAREEVVGGCDVGHLNGVDIVGVDPLTLAGFGSIASCSSEARGDVDAATILGLALAFALMVERKVVE